MAAETSDAQNVPNIGQLEARASDLLFGEEFYTEVEEQLEARAAQYLGFTMAIGLVGLTHNTISPQFWGAKRSLRSRRTRFTRSYNKLYPDDPIRRSQSVEVAKAVLELAHIEAISFE